MNDTESRMAEEAAARREGRREMIRRESDAALIRYLAGALKESFGTTAEDVLAEVERRLVGKQSA